MNDATAAFELLADETRVGILQALAERQRDDPRHRALSFAELRKRVGTRDSGNFSYHLDKLTGTFVEKTDDGYRLTFAGIRVVGAIMGGYQATVDERTTELDEACPRCDSTIEVRYRDGLLGVRCGNGHGFNNVVPPRALADRSMTEAADFLALQSYHDLFLASHGGCPQCYGRMTWRADTDGDGEDPVRYVGQCQDCGLPFTLWPGQMLLLHPGTAAAFWTAGRNVWEEPVRWLFSAFSAEVLDHADDGTTATVRIDTEETTVTTRVDVADGTVSMSRLD